MTNLSLTINPRSWLVTLSRWASEMRSHDFVTPQSNFAYRTGAFPLWDGSRWDNALQWKDWTPVLAPWPGGGPGSIGNMSINYAQYSELDTIVLVRGDIRGQVLVNPVTALSVSSPPIDSVDYDFIPCAVMDNAPAGLFFGGVGLSFSPASGGVMLFFRYDRVAYTTNIGVIFNGFYQKLNPK